MPPAKRLKLEDIDLEDQKAVDEFMEQVIARGMERVRAETEELRRRGILDKDGKLLIKELPPDMREGSDRDFGG